MICPVCGAKRPYYCTRYEERSHDIYQQFSCFHSILSDPPPALSRFVLVHRKREHCSRWCCQYFSFWLAGDDMGSFCLNDSYVPVVGMSHVYDFVGWNQ